MRAVTTPADPKDLKKYNARVEKEALAALAVGDVRKALQNSTRPPIAPTCEHTYMKLVDLNPPGSEPSPIKERGRDALLQDRHRLPLSTFGPGSAGSLLDSLYGSSLAQLVRLLAREAALKPILAGGVSIALPKTETATRLWQSNPDAS